MENVANAPDSAYLEAPINIIANEVEVETERCSENTSITKEQVHTVRKPKRHNFFEPNDYSNGAIFDELNYCWSQTINEIEIHVRLPGNIRSSSQIRVVITSNSIKITTRDDAKVIDGILAEKCRHNEAVWTLSPEGKLNINLDKHKELWWKHLFLNEPEINLSKIDCSRPVEELPDETQNDISRIQYDEIQKLAGKSTTAELKNIEALKKAWNAEGSPFKGTPFDPSVLKFESSD